ncbi:MAG: hypothetical protein IJR79_01255 [Clostridia bacterium]|nr:hypothetical protein [Clostridia bacterium]MBQ7751583.1 hypothetical protein [Clostridia bacterium]
MWTVVYMSKDEGDILALRQALKNIKVISFVKKSDEFFTLLVPSREVSLAHKIIIDMEI